MPQDAYSKAGIVRTIQKLRRTGKPLNYSAVRNSHGPLLVHAREKFGTWKAAVQAAGFDYGQITLIRRWSNREILDQLRDLCRQRKIPDISTLSRNHSKLYGACCRKYGSGLAALQAAGIDYEQLLGEHPYRWTRAQIIAEMKRRYEQGKTLCRAEILRKEPKLHRFCFAATHQFGNWSKALRAAGLNPGSIRNRDGMWPREKVLAGIRSRHAKGKLLNTDLMLRDDLPLHAAGRRHFGTWREAVEQAGINYNQHVRGGLFGWTRGKARVALRDRLRQGATQKHVHEHAPSLFRAAIHYFGSWEKAVHTARRGK